jgi:hypothetical protein
MRWDIGEEEEEEEEEGDGEEEDRVEDGDITGLASYLFWAFGGCE